MCLEYDSQKRFTADQALSHEWIIEGLPPQLQVQHLKFIKETAPSEKKEESNKTPNSAKGKGVDGLRSSYVEDFSTHNVERKRGVSNDKTMPNVSMRIVQGNDDKEHEKSIEDDTNGPLSGKQTKLFTRKVSF